MRNMTKILDSILKGDVERKRRTLSKAIAKLNGPLEDANSAVDTSRGYKGKLADKAYGEYLSEVRGVREFLEGKGFSEMGTKEYGDEEIMGIATKSGLV